MKLSRLGLLILSSCLLSSCEIRFTFGYKTETSTVQVSSTTVVSNATESSVSDVSSSKGPMSVSSQQDEPSTYSSVQGPSTPDSQESSVEEPASYEESSIEESSAVESSPEESSISTMEESSISSSAETQKTGDITLYALNDFHGACKEDGYEKGIVKLGSFFKEKGQEENTLILNSGDFFQGSIESNSNYGEMLTKIMNDVQFDCFTLGNHEFDWGLDYISTNKDMSDATTGYQTPFLAANIYDYDIDTGIEGNYADLGDKYTIKTLENGLKVGIIGCIGKDQITSITSTIVDDLVFKDPAPIVKELSDELKTQKGCDAVILDLHAGQDTALNQGLTDVSSLSGKKYVDAVFCAHTHSTESTSENGVPFVQGGCNGQAYSQVTLHVDENGDVTCNSYSTPYTSSITFPANDTNILNYYNTYKALSDTKGNEVLCTLSGSFSAGVTTNSSSSATGNYISTFATEAIGWACSQNGNSYTIDYAVCNKGRANISGGSVTYADLYKALPFDNEIYIATVTGADLVNELKYNQFTRYTTEAIDNSTTYTIAVIDYLATHRNTNRDYDYFPSLQIVDTVTDNGSLWNYREITADYMKHLSNVTASDYANSLAEHSYSSLTSAI